MSQTGKRQCSYIDNKVQGSLIRRVLFHWLAFFVSVALSIGVIQVLMGDPNQPVVENLRLAYTKYAMFFVIMLALLPAFVLDTIKISNRFVGPIYRLRTVLKSGASGGKFTPVRFRDGDFWPELAEEFNQFVEQQRKLTLAEANSKRPQEESVT